MSKKKGKDYLHPYALEYHEELDLNLRVGKRFDPFSDEIPDLSQLMADEMCIPGSNDAGTREKQVVEEAISLLSVTDKEIIIRWFFMGQTIQEIGDHYTINVEQTRYLRNKAIENLRALLRKGLFGSSDVELHQDCPICIHPDSESISEFLHLWWDYKKQSVREITPILAKKFSPELAAAINSSILRAHLLEHLHLGRSIHNKKENRKRKWRT